VAQADLVPVDRVDPVDRSPVDREAQEAQADLVTPVAQTDRVDPVDLVDLDPAVRAAPVATITPAAQVDRAGPAATITPAAQVDRAAPAATITQVDLVVPAGLVARVDPVAHGTEMPSVATSTARRGATDLALGGLVRRRDPHGTVRYLRREAGGMLARSTTTATRKTRSGIPGSTSGALISSESGSRCKEQLSEYDARFATWRGGRRHI
jgi:hypothetical protein